MTLRHSKLKANKIVQKRKKKKALPNLSLLGTLVISAKPATDAMVKTDTKA